MNKLKLPRRIGKTGRIIIYSQEEYFSLLNALQLLDSLGIEAESAIKRTTRVHGDEWENCDYCEEPLCECYCEENPRYIREYDDGASLED